MIYQVSILDHEVTNGRQWNHRSSRTERPSVFSGVAAFHRQASGLYIELAFQAWRAAQVVTRRWVINRHVSPQNELGQALAFPRMSIPRHTSAVCCLATASSQLCFPHGRKMDGGLSADNVEKQKLMPPETPFSSSPSHPSRASLRARIQK